MGGISSPIASLVTDVVAAPISRLYLMEGILSAISGDAGLLFYAKTPNGTGGNAGKYVLTAGSASIYAATGSDWYTDVNTPLALTDTQILALASCNDYHILYSAAKGLAIYDPYTTTQVTIDKAHRFYKATVYQDDVPTAFFNGLDFTNATYTGGPTIVADNTGALVNAGTNKPGVMGARLDGSIWYDTALDGTPIVASTSQPTRVGVIATTIAEGATLGQELVVDCTASKWTASGSNTVEQDGDAVKITYVDNNIGAKYFLRSTNGALLAAGSLYAARLYITFRAKINSGKAKAWVVSDSSGMIFTFADLTTEFVEYSVEFKNLDVFGGYWNITFYNFSTTEVIWVKDVSVKVVYPTYIAPFFTPGTTFKRYSSANPTTMPGWLCETARTNYALNSASPATHTIANIAAGTYTLWQEGSGSIAATAGTAVGTFGTASNETPARITITAGGTVVLTASGTNTWVQLELGAFKTSRITTTAESATRAGTVCTYNTAGVIRENNMAMLIRCTPRAAGQTAYLWGCYSDISYILSIVLSPSNIALRKRINGTNTDATVSYTHAADTPIEVLCVFSTAHGMCAAVRAYSGGVWGAWTNGTTVTTTAAKADAVIASTYQLGALNSANQMTGNISLFDTLLLPDGIPDPLKYAKAKWGLPA